MNDQSLFYSRDELLRQRDSLQARVAQLEEALREPPDSLDAAWAEAEAALPEGRKVDAVAIVITLGTDVFLADGESPATALRALAAKLEKTK